MKYDVQEHLQPRGLTTLRDVMNHYDGFLRLGLTEQEKSDLIQHLLGL